MKQPKELCERLSDYLQNYEPKIHQQKKEQILNETLIAFAAFSRKSNCAKCFLCRACSWMLDEIAESESENFNEACKCLINKETDEKEKVKAIIEILENMHGSIDLCCRNNPVRLFFDAREEHIRFSGRYFSAINRRRNSVRHLPIVPKCIITSKKYAQFWL